MQVSLNVIKIPAQIPLNIEMHINVKILFQESDYLLHISKFEMKLLRNDTRMEQNMPHKLLSLSILMFIGYQKWLN